MSKLLKIRTIALLSIFMVIVITITSCMVISKPGRSRKGNNGNHKGWNKGKGNKHSQSTATPWEPVKYSKE